MTHELTSAVAKSERQIRLEKLEKIRKLGIDPYPARSARTHTIAQVLEQHDKLAKSGDEVTVTGRLRSVRSHGGSSFAHLQDGSGQIQLFLKKDELSSPPLQGGGREGISAYNFFTDLIDVADFIEATGTAYTTKKGELSILLKSFKLLAKALEPLPEKFHGLKDEEELFRKRYLDILTNKKTRELFAKRTKFWNVIRNFLTKHDFFEVQTPVLEVVSGGADARPFITHHNALDMDVYLRISAGELWQKRLMVAGFDKTFEIGRIFRNEGIDAEHAQDYMQMEFYWAYADWEDGMTLVEELIKHTAQKVFSTLKFTIRDYKVDFGKNWTRYDYRQEILDRTNIDIEKTSVGEIKTKLHELKVQYDDFNNLPRGIDQLWKYCRRQIAGPGYLVYPPKEIAPLSKESKERPGYTEQYSLIFAGTEQCKGYTEVNDPLDQEERFIKQQARRDAGDEEAQMMDRDYVEALKHGMPPTTGLGISERLFAYLADKTLREAQIFPLMKPRTLNHKNT